jgi:hypothetical protein
VKFTKIQAGTKHHGFDLTPHGFITEIQGKGGADLTVATINSGTSATVKWKKKA